MSLEIPKKHLSAEMLNQVQVTMIFLAGITLAHEYTGNLGFAVTLLALALRPRFRTTQGE